MTGKWAEAATGMGVIRRWTCLLLVALSAVSVFWGMANAKQKSMGSMDFQWDAARILLERQNPYELTLNGGAWTDRIMPDPLCANQFPSCLVLLWPYAIFPWPVARVLWAVSNLMFTAILLREAFRRFFPGADRWTLVACSSLLLMSAPWRDHVGGGQHALFSLAFFMLGLRYADRRNPVAAGLFLAVSLFKYTLTFPLFLVLLYRRQYRPVAVAFVVHGVLHGLMCLWLGMGPLQLIAQPLEVVRPHVALGYVDYFAFMSKLGVGSLAPWASIGLFALMALVCLRRRESDELRILGMAGIVGMAIVYHRFYDCVVLVFPLIGLFRDRTGGMLRWLTVLSIALVFFVERVVEGLTYRYGYIDIAWLMDAVRWTTICAFHAMLMVGMIRFFLPPKTDGGPNSTSTPTSPA